MISDDDIKVQHDQWKHLYTQSILVVNSLLENK